MSILLSIYSALPALEIFIREEGGGRGRGWRSPAQAFRGLRDGAQLALEHLTGEGM